MLIRSRKTNKHKEIWRTPPLPDHSHPIDVSRLSRKNVPFVPRTFCPICVVLSEDAMGGSKKEGGGKPHEWQPSQKIGSGPPRTVRFPPPSSVSALFLCVLIPALNLSKNSCVFSLFRPRLWEENSTKTHEPTTRKVLNGHWWQLAGTKSD